MATQISRKTAELMAKKLRAKLDALYADQESHPSKQQGGDTPMYSKGGFISRLRDNRAANSQFRQFVNNDPMFNYLSGRSSNNSSIVDPSLNYNIQNAYDQVGDYGRYHNVASTSGTGEQKVNTYNYEPESYNLAPTGSSSSGTSPIKQINYPATSNYSIPDPRQGYGNEDGFDPSQRALAGPYVPQTTTPLQASYGDVGGPTMNLTGSQNASAPAYETTQSAFKSASQQGQSPEGNNTDWAGIAGAVGSFAPGLYNLYNAFQKPEVENPKDYYNPQYNNAMSLMRNRRFDVRPLLEQNQMNQNTYNRNIRNTASSRGELLSNMGGGYANRLRSDSAAYTQKSQMDAGYRGEEAQMRAQLGQQRAQTNMQVGDWNARNRAAQRNYGAAAAGNIGDASSLLLRNRNMKSADAMRTEAMTAAFPYLKEWMPGLEEMMKKYNTKG